MKEWVMHFKQMYNPLLTLTEYIHYADPFIRDDFLHNRFTMEELNLVLAKAKENKSLGMERIPYEFFNNATKNVLGVLIDQHSNIYSLGLVALNYNQLVIFPLYKKGDRSVVGNYRGISFENTVAKFFTGLFIIDYLPRYKRKE